ncbi:type II toxin-antitoxin system VapC family toxin [Ottowia testudinis]|uniref:Type II toxin-antitoxin system VapC family toxin n=1 Tax=Ottowia testudinis TaxID=2816950 RepID=A0A975H4S5_9BURK|nr:type II toxin-antitoxin system VapC family toxin [Ottowia testudinis]QTD46680.1 type II toxin-antitoxin system VapC family toxin [Ottowia testudinis]
MKLLLDTHALIWWWTNDAQLPASARALIADEALPVLVSAASAWEMATKHRLGKLGSVSAALPRFNALVQADGFGHLPITWPHALKAGSHAADNRDPFDRMLAAQADLEGLTLVTRDDAFAQFGVRTVW